jgi:LmbE family N-acetylglucosaminyl deacetylase
VPPPLRLLCVLAHPDDESLGCGGLLAKSAAEGVETFLVTATRGERGRIGNERPGPEVVGPVREAELRRAAEALGLRELVQLDYPDGALDTADPRRAATRIAAEVRRLRPQVVVTFASEGSYGHPDHIAISQLTGAALVAAADPGYPAAAGVALPDEPHRVDKHYWMAWDAASFDLYQRSIGSELRSRVDGVERRVTPWPSWAVTTRIDAREHWETVWRAVQCHASQISGYGGIPALTPDRHRELWGGTQSFYRVFSLVNGGRAPETDVFAGLRRGGS